MIPDQKKLWDEIHDANKYLEGSKDPNPFAKTVLKHLGKGKKVLELGCGNGADSRFFAERGIDILATDFSSEIIEQNKQQVTKNLEFKVLDISKPYPFGDNKFDAVYAHLSLHYYPDAVTRQIITEIHRVIKPSSLFLFKCKSIHDPLYGLGEEIEPNMFISKGHIRHFFTKEYAKELINGKFHVVLLEETTGEYANKLSNFIECVARKK